MRLESEIRDGVNILRLKGRFVTGSEAELASAKTSLQEAGVARAIVDLRGVPYIDSTGLAFVVELHKTLQKRGGQLVLANVNPRVREVLAMTRISEVVPAFDDEDAAVAALRASGLLAGCAGR
jgi:anti-sigma B factor antagonist